MEATNNKESSLASTAAATADAAATATTTETAKSSETQTQTKVDNVDAIQEVFRTDYQPLQWKITKIHMNIQFGIENTTTTVNDGDDDNNNNNNNNNNGDEKTRITSRLFLEKNDIPINTNKNNNSHHHSPPPNKKIKLDTNNDNEGENLDNDNHDSSSSSSSSSVLILDGDETLIKLVKLSIQVPNNNNDNNNDTTTSDIELTENQDYFIGKPHSGKLTISSNHLCHGCIVTTIIELFPKHNTHLMGLYQTMNEKTKQDKIYSTQCEAMGFRRITYYLDRPDNMAIFESVRLEANRNDYPVLLSNGNLIESGIVNGVDGDGDVGNDGVGEEPKDNTNDNSTSTTSTSTIRHYAIWSDPFPKPSYLFCCIAGNLEYIQDSFVTSTDRKEVQLRIYSQPKDVSKLHHAMKSLKQAMKWDEEKYGLVYDLDIFNIVAIDSFNMGAMENKGLNVFNTTCVLADRHSATDETYERIQAIVGHEYFHNWTGNRVTCRDWFQLTLKEGLTVFRDQEFSADMTQSPGVARIQKVKFLRSVQFAEDASPMAHPIRPESYISMDNFYTPTVYRKGAEIIRMYQTILGGHDAFRKGMDLYFQRHDGCAVTCEDFLQAMQDANNNNNDDGNHPVDLTQFAKWYSTSGTPTVTYEYKYDKEQHKFLLTLTQQLPPQQKRKKESNNDKGKDDNNDNDDDGPDPLHIPVSVGLLDKVSCQEIVPTRVLHLKEWTQTFEFSISHDDDNNKKDDDVVIIPSILRHFSAPVKLIPSNGEKEDEEMLAFLAAYDTDDFNKWEAGQKMYTLLIFQHYYTNKNKNNNNKSTDPEQATNETMTTTTMTTSSISEQTIKYVHEAFSRTLEVLLSQQQQQEDASPNHENGNNKTSKTIVDYSMIAYALMLPTQSTLAELLPPGEKLDPSALQKACNDIQINLARTFQTQLQQCYDLLTKEEEQEQTKNNNNNGNKEIEEYSVDATSIGRRRLYNVCLEYLCSIKDTIQEQTIAANLAKQHFQKARGMTDKLASLSILVSMNDDGDNNDKDNNNTTTTDTNLGEISKLREEAIQTFYNDANGDGLIINKWFAIQASTAKTTTTNNDDNNNGISQMMKLLQHDDFSYQNPNRCRALMVTFVKENVSQFHNTDGSGYEFVSNFIQTIDPINPQVASKLAKELIAWNKYDTTRADLMKQQLQTLSQMKPISKDLYEIVMRGLK